MHSTQRLLLPLSAISIALAGTATAQTWSDDFETYANGSALETQGGWTGWDGVTTAFTVVSNAQAQSGMQSIQANPGADTVYQFTPATTGKWEFIGHIYAPTGFTSDLDYMVMNKYAHFGPYEWGSWVSISGSTATVTCNCGGVGAASAPLPFDRWVEIREVIDLDNDFADIYFDGQLLASYVWSDGFSGSTGHLVPAIEALDIYPTGGGMGLFIDNLSLTELSGPIGTSYCGPAVLNSTGAPGALTADGVVGTASNDVTLTAGSLPSNSFGFFLCSMTQGFVSNPGGSQGNLCLGGSIGRYVGPGQIKNSGTAGSFDLTIDLAQTPQPTGSVSVAPGDTWNYQTWYRDAVGGVATSNFTDGLTITFN